MTSDGEMTDSRRVRRGIYLLPTLFTVGSLFCGFSSIVQASMGRLELAAILIVVAGVLDGLDGRIARLTGTSSEFGRHFDSLADIISFGIAPAFLAYTWALTPLKRVGWLIAFLFVVCVAMRLARFNIQRTLASKRYFVGLPSPPAAAAIACLVYAFPARPERSWVSALVGTMVVGIAVLVVSRLRYRSFKDLDLRARHSYLYVLPLAAVLVAILTHPAGTLLSLSAAYLVSGPFGYLWGWISRHRARDLDEPAAAEALDGSSR